MDDDTPEPTRLHLQELSNTASVGTLGLVVARLLQQRLIATLMVAEDGSVEVVPAGELELDGLPEQAALLTLVERGYADQQMSEYLRQRETRLARTAVGGE